MPPPIPPDPVGDPELARLIDAHGGALYGIGVAGVGDPEGVAWDARIALLGYIAAHYVRRDSVNHYAYLDRMTTALEARMRRDATRPPASPPGSYKAARGILPWTPGDELPEERIRRLRDGD